MAAPVGFFVGEHFLGELGGIFWGDVFGLVLEEELEGVVDGGRGAEFLDPGDVLGNGEFDGRPTRTGHFGRRGRSSASHRPYQELAAAQEAGDVGLAELEAIGLAGGNCAGDLFGHLFGGGLVFFFATGTQGHTFAVPLAGIEPAEFLFPIVFAARF